MILSIVNKKSSRPRPITENRGHVPADRGIISGKMMLSVCAMRKAFFVRNEVKEGGFLKNLVTPSVNYRVPELSSNRARLRLVLLIILAPRFYLASVGMLISENITCEAQPQRKNLEHSRSTGSTWERGELAFLLSINNI